MEFAGSILQVYTAEYISRRGPTTVAVKTLRGEMDVEMRKKFLKEARVMRKLDHPHIARFTGVAVHETPLMMIMEFCEGGRI
jgi:serine/threonine protein kinase